ncbi:MAG TPA: right-handed parallel beta-helix repeat-containing protein [Dehalococcoidia bacterium]|nr:right-handed parallel beta-helix repeat-containing protein [Dehalococcoidia bacterium]
MPTFFNRLNTLLLMLLVLMAAAIIAILAQRASAGPLDPPSAPGPTLPQVAPRSPIPPVGWDGLTWPIVISTPGSYFLTRNLGVNSGSTSAIQVTASDVTIDLNGFTLDGLNGACCGHGIDVAAVISNLTVRNGTLRRWSTGIQANGNVTGYATQSRFEDLLVTDSGAAGIRADSGTVIQRVTVQRTNGTGIRITDQGFLYLGGLIEDCVVTENTLGVNIQANNVTLRRCVVDSSTNDGATVSGAFDVLVDNTFQGTNVGPGVALSGSVNTVTRNVFANVAGGAVVNTGVANRIGPLDGTLTGTQPWSNAGP